MSARQVWLGKVVSAAFTIFLTTADDALWLVPFVASSKLSTGTKAANALTFALTLQVVVGACILISAVSGSALSKLVDEGSSWTPERVLSAVGAALCWSIAIFLFVRKMLKQRRRRMQKAFGYGAVPAKADADDADDADAADDAALRDAPPTPEARDGDGEEVDAPSPRTILCLTMLGALDEVSYFPALLVGGVFTDSELACGTVLASAVVLTLITTRLAAPTQLE